MLGTVIGDIVGSAYEFNNHRHKDFTPFFHARAKFTDDTVCAMAIAEALLDQKSAAHSLKAWGRRYEDNGGWGQRFFLWLASDDLKPYNSYGNGAAMRIAPVAWLAPDLMWLREMTYAVTAITHNHPEGIKGAMATSSAIYWARIGESKVAIRNLVEEYYGYDMGRSVDEIRPGYRHNESCQKTVPEALICALEAANFEDAIRNAVSLGGDSDTLAAIAGSLAEALHGIPNHITQTAFQHLPEEMMSLLRRFYLRVNRPLPQATTATTTAPKLSFTADQTQ